MNTDGRDYEQEFSHKLAVFLLVPLSVLLVGLLTTFYVKNTTAVIDGASMEPQLLTEDLVLVTRGYENPSRGDVIVIQPKRSGENPDALAKRVVGLPGDAIEIRQGRAIVNGEIEHGDYTVYVAEGDIEAPRSVVPEGHVYVLGDNRPVSEDSRLFGTVPLDWVIGEVTWVIQPIDRFGRVD